MTEFEAIGEQLKYEDNGFSCRRAEEIIKIQFVGTEIVRCKDCKWRGTVYCYGKVGTMLQMPDDFCSRGERKDRVEE